MVQLAPRFTALLAFCFLASATPIAQDLQPYLSAGVIKPTADSQGAPANHTARAVLATNSHPEVDALKGGQNLLQPHERPVCRLTLPKPSCY